MNHDHFISPNTSNEDNRLNSDKENPISNDNLNQINNENKLIDYNLNHNLNINQENGISENNIEISTNSNLDNLSNKSMDVFHNTNVISVNEQELNTIKADEGVQITENTFAEKNIQLEYDKHLKDQLSNEIQPDLPSIHELSCFDLSGISGSIFSLQSIPEYNIAFYSTIHQLYCLVRKWNQHWELVEIPLFNETNDSFNRGVVGSISSSHSHGNSHVIDPMSADLEIVSFNVSLLQNNTNYTPVQNQIQSNEGNSNINSNLIEGSSNKYLDIILNVGFVHPLMKQNATLNFYRINTWQLLKGSQKNSISTIGPLTSDVGGNIVRSHSSTSISSVIIRRNDKSTISPPPKISNSRIRNSMTSDHISGTLETDTIQLDSVDSFSERRIVNSESMPLIRGRSNSKPTAKITLFEAKRSKRQISCTHIGSCPLSSVPLRHYPFTATFSKKVGHRIVSEQKRVYIVTSTEKNVQAFLQEDRGNLVQIDVAEIIPEISTNYLKSSILTLSILQVRNLRFVVIGGQNGWVRLTIFDTIDQRIHSSSQIYLNGLISSLQLFNIVEKKQSVFSTLQTINEKIYSVFNSDEFNINLAVAESTGRVLLFKDILREQLSNQSIIGSFDDAILCVEVSDLYATGSPCILVGTYSCKLYIYVLKEKFEIKQIEYFESPVYGIQILDTLKDGIRDIVVLTLNQLCILRLDLNSIHKSLQRKINKLIKVKELNQTIDDLKNQLQEDGNRDQYIQDILEKFSSQEFIDILAKYKNNKEFISNTNEINISTNFDHDTIETIESNSNSSDSKKDTSDSDENTSDSDDTSDSDYSN